MSVELHYKGFNSHENDIYDFTYNAWSSPGCFEAFLDGGNGGELGWDSLDTGSSTNETFATSGVCSDDTGGSPSSLA